MSDANTRVVGFLVGVSVPEHITHEMLEEAFDFSMQSLLDDEFVGEHITALDVECLGDVEGLDTTSEEVTSE